MDMLTIMKRWQSCLKTPNLLKWHALSLYLHADAQMLQLEGNVDRATDEMWLSLLAAEHCNDWNTKGVCPVCNGTKKQEVSYTWKSAKEVVACRNCGGQTMLGEATGTVSLRLDGTPCKHEYEVAHLAHCYTRSTCIHCGHSYDMDSSD